MKRRLNRYQQARRRRGFTLVELVIVGALIALFSSLAVFSVQQQFRSNLRKATIGETRQIATSLDFANLDTSIFPKLCFLAESREGIAFLAQQMGESPTQLFGSLEMYNRGAAAVQSGSINNASRIFNQWDGPYFALSQARAGVSQGRGGYTYMLLPDLNASGPNSTTTPGGIRWPADPYNNPYVVYMLDLVLGTPSFLQFVPDGQDLGRKGNYVNAVVSYGPNNYPGGVEFEEPRILFQGSGDPFDQTGGSTPYALRLYTGRPGFTGEKGAITFRWRGGDLNFDGLARERANMWSRDFFNVGGVTPYAPSSGLGIADPGSDDIVFEF